MIGLSHVTVQRQLSELQLSPPGMTFAAKEAQSLFDEMTKTFKVAYNSFLETRVFDVLRYDAFRYHKDDNKRFFFPIVTGECVPGSDFFHPQIKISWRRIKELGAEHQTILGDTRGAQIVLAMNSQKDYLKETFFYWSLDTFENVENVENVENDNFIT